VDSNISYVTGGDNRKGVCKVVIDKGSGRGGHVRVGRSPATKTGPDQTGYEVLDIPPLQDFWVYGSCAVLFIYYL